MAYEELKSSGITADTPKNILFGAGTIHKGLKLTTGKWNFAESLIGATSGGFAINITPELTDLEIDGKLVKVKSLSDLKTGETATMEINLIEIKPDIIKALVVGKEAESETYEGYTEITSKNRISDGDYIENLAYVGKKIDGTPIIIIFELALVSGGFSINPQNKSASVSTATFECVASLEGDHDRLPYHILYPTPQVQTLNDTDKEDA